LNWDASVDPGSWLRIASPPNGTAGLDSSIIRVNFDENLGGARTGVVYFSAIGAIPNQQMVTVSQDAAPPPAPVVTRFAFSSVGPTQLVNVPFTVSITAVNDEPQAPAKSPGAPVQTAFNGRVDLAGTSNAKVAPAYVVLANGTWTGTITLDNVEPNATLHAYSAEASGKSDDFVVTDLVSTSRTLVIQTTLQDGTLLEGASVYLEDNSGLLRQGATGHGGIIAFDNLEVKKYFVSARSGTALKCSQEEVSAADQAHSLILRSSKPPVLLVPGLPGSCISKNWHLLCSCTHGKNYCLYPTPVLGSSYPTRQRDMQFLNAYDFAGWDSLEQKLAVQHEVYRVPWDWRMPFLRADQQGYVAWQQYLTNIIQKAKEETDSGQVDVVAHSKGGLLARAYIQSDSYLYDIRRFAMVATPNQGVAVAYYPWEGGQPELADSDTRCFTDNNECFWTMTFKGLYEVMTSKRWSCIWPCQSATSNEKRTFVQLNVRSIWELMPVWAALSKPGGGFDHVLGYEKHPLHELNMDSRLIRLGTSNGTDPQQVKTKVFLATNEATVSGIVVGMQGEFPLYPSGVPRCGTWDRGDGTVWYNSATLDGRFDAVDTKKGDHASLVGTYGDDIVSFLEEKSGLVMLAGAPRAKDPNVPVTVFSISAIGRSQPYLVDPFGNSAGVLEGSYSNGILGAEVSLAAEGGTVSIENPADGLYHYSIRGIPGDFMKVDAAYVLPSTLLLTTNLNFIIGSNEVLLSITINSNVMGVAASVDAAADVTASELSGVTRLTWFAPQSTNVVGYRVYSRKSYQPHYSLIGETTSTFFMTGDAWIHDGGADISQYVVVSVDSQARESGFNQAAENRSSLVANFFGGPLVGLPPLTVRFTNSSLGEVSSISWDFNNDGVTDSMDANPTCLYTEPGSYPVSVTVSGPDGVDQKIAVGMVSVVPPELRQAALTSDSFGFSIDGEAGRTYEIQVSSNLREWSRLTTIIASNSVAYFSEALATNAVQRFFRIRLE